MIFFVRAAFCLVHDDESHATERLHIVMDELLKKNRMQMRHIKSIFFTQTHDIVGSNAASCLRKREAYQRVPLFTAQEACVKNTLPMTIRIMVTAEKFLKLNASHPVYMFGAETLRPDLHKT